MRPYKLYNMLKKGWFENQPTQGEIMNCLVVCPIGDQVNHSPVPILYRKALTVYYKFETSQQGRTVKLSPTTDFNISYSQLGNCLCIEHIEKYLDDFEKTEGGPR